ncbi:LURP-one-related family protein [Citricoccus nitrophenolicus]
MSPTSSLSGQNLLVMQQVTGFMSNDFAIENGEGLVVAHGHTRGSAASRMFRGNRQFEIQDLDGTPLFRVEDPMTLGRDRYRVTGPQGEPIAEIVQRISFFRTSVAISVVDGTDLQLDGSLSGFSFRLMAGQAPVASVDRKWAGLGRAMLGRSRYAVELDPGMPEVVRYAVIGSVIALDLIRDKASNNN